MSEPNNYPLKTISLDHSMCQLLDRAAIFDGADGIAALANREPKNAYELIRNARQAQLIVTGMSVSMLPEQMPKNQGGRISRLAVVEASKNFVDNELPIYELIVDPFRLVLEAVNKRSLRELLTGKPKRPPTKYAEFIVPAPR